MGVLSIVTDAKDWSEKKTQRKRALGEEPLQMNA